MSEFCRLAAGKRQFSIFTAWKLVVYSEVSASGGFAIVLDVLLG
jgi:hypothetical protein